MPKSETNYEELLKLFLADPQLFLRKHEIEVPDNMPQAAHAPNAQMTISIDASAGKWAVFIDHFDMVRQFEPYEDQHHAELLGRIWCRHHSTAEPQIVRPTLTGVRYG